MLYRLDVAVYINAEKLLLIKYCPFQHLVDHFLRQNKLLFNLSNLECQQTPCQSEKRREYWEGENTIARYASEFVGVRLSTGDSIGPALRAWVTREREIVCVCVYVCANLCYHKELSTSYARACYAEIISRARIEYSYASGLFYPKFNAILHVEINSRNL